MRQEVLRYRIDISYSGTFGGFTFDSTDYISVMYDDSDDSITLDLYDQFNTLIGSPTSGPSLADPSGFHTLLTPFPYGRVCVGTTLHAFTPSAIFPYVIHIIYDNHYLCTISAPVCDLNISSSYSETKPTGPTNTDGEITISASSSNGAIKYSLDPAFDYVTGGQASGTFSSLAPGEYTITAKDAIGCVDSILISLGYEYTYGVRWRLQYRDLNGKTSRVDILEKDFVGSVTDVIGDGDDPFVLRYAGENEDKFKTLIGSFATLNLISETNFQFIDLFTQDERRFQVKWYKNIGAGYELKWIGYITPLIYSEPFTEKINYPVAITATDGIGDLKEFDFLDISGNKYRGYLPIIYIVTQILRKLDINVSVRSAVNIFESSMDQADTDDPLAQAFIDPVIFYNEDEPKKCDEVLDEILKIFGVRVFQSKGYWWIVSIEDTAATFAYRQFSIDGLYESNSTYSPRIELKGSTQTIRAVWTDDSALLTILGNYGKMSVIQDLGLDNTVFNNGTFEPEEFNTSGYFNKWTFYLGQPGTRTGLELVDNENSKGALFVDYKEVLSAGENIIASQPISFDYDEKDHIKLRFQYLLRPRLSVPWIRFAWELKLVDSILGDLYLSPQGRWTTNSNYGKNYIYATQYFSFQDFDIDAILPTGTGTGTLQLKFYTDGQFGHDYNDIASLKAVATTLLEGGTRKVTVFQTPNIQLRYTLERNTDAESSPDIVRPTDFNSSTNPKIWKLENSFIYYDPYDPVSINLCVLDTLLLDNVRVEFLPDGTQPIKTKTFSDVLNKDIKNNLTVNVVYGDVPTDILNAKSIYKGHIRLSDGTPTALWSRSSTAESLSLLYILKLMYIGQYTTPIWKLTGSVTSDIDIDFINVINDKINSEDKIYLQMMLEISDKNCDYSIEMQQLLSGVNNIPPPPTPYSLLLETGDDLLLETGDQITLET